MDKECLIPFNVSMVFNHCKNLLEEMQISANLLRVLNITALLVRLAQTITKYLGIKYFDLCFQEKNYCYLLAYTTICSTLLIDCTKVGGLLPFLAVRLKTRVSHHRNLLKAKIQGNFSSAYSLDHTNVLILINTN